MNKSQIICNLSSKAELFSDDDIERSINAILKLFSDSLANADRVEIRNFGTFSTRKRQRRISRNPKTGKSVLVEAKNHPYFRASKHLKESLNK
tara:strand:+ start:541 stop:819 length:279 start_codon:yes stop_codon:yes gene_type:complete